jgi:DNA-binding response OmpR family regulator
MANKRLLIIEDDFDVAEMLLMYFTSHQYEVFHADSGPAGIEMARTRFPNLILLDVMLPHMDGYEVCRRLRQTSLTKYIPTIFLTQRDERADKVRGLELGADDYITKPFDIEELKLRVQGSIRRATRESLHESRTGLPTGPLIQDELNRRQLDDDYTEIRFDLDGFREYGDVYGFMAADEVFGYAARAIQEIVSRDGTENDFVGVLDNFFIVLTHARKVDALEEAIKANFANGVQAFYSFLDIDRGGIVVKADNGGEVLVPLMGFRSYKSVRSNL